MASVEHCQNFPVGNPRTVVDYLIYCTRCRSAICLSVTKHADHAQDSIDQDLNRFQRTQWTKHGQIMPSNWIDPFEIYD